MIISRFLLSLQSANRDVAPSPSSDSTTLGAGESAISTLEFRVVGSVGGTAARNGSEGAAGSRNSGFSDDLAGEERGREHVEMCSFDSLRE